MLPSEDLKRRNTAAKDWYLFISYASAIIQGPPIFHCDPKFFQLYHSLMDSSMLFFTKFLPKIPGGFSHPNQWAAHRLCKDRLYPFRAGKSARKRSLARVRPKSLPKKARGTIPRAKKKQNCVLDPFLSDDLHTTHVHPERFRDIDRSVGIEVVF